MELTSLAEYEYEEYQMPEDEYNHTLMEKFNEFLNFYDGQTLTVALQMSDEGYARWKDVVKTYTALENNRKLTDAEVEVLEGYAQMLRQSGIKVDTKEGMTFYHPLYWWFPERPPTKP